MKELKPLRISKSNDLVMASYRLTLNEQRLLLAAICKLDPRRPMPKVVTVTASDYADIYKIPIRHAYQYLKDSADDLYDRDIQTFDGKGMERKRWVDKARYVPGEGRVDLSFTIHVMPYLSMLHSKVTTYDLRRVANLDSSHSFRFFEMLMQFRSTGWAYIEVDSLRIALGLGEAYQRFNNLRQRVIDPAINELKEKSGLEITYELKSVGRKVTAIKFLFKDTLQMPLALDDPNKIGVSFPEVEPATEDEGEWTLTRPLGELAQEQMGEFSAIDAAAG